MSGPGAALADFVAATTFDRLPSEVVRESKRCVLDHLGVSLGALDWPAPQIALAEARAVAGTPEATLLGYGDRLPAATAALVGGILSHVLDFDDTHALTILHATSPTLAAALPVAEFAGRSGRDLILAHALGFEAGARVSVALWPAHHEAGWHMTGTSGVICAAAAAGRLLELDGARMAHALGLAATQAAGHREQFGTMAKAFHVGRAAASGVLAVRLAARGYTSAAEAFEGRRGMLAVMSSGENADALQRDLGERWEILRNGVKPYSCGVVIHPAIDVARRLREQGVSPDQLERLDLQVHPFVLELCGKRDPSLGLEGKFSVTYAVATMLHDGAARERQFTDDAVRRPEVRETARRIAPRDDPSIGTAEARGSARLRDGRLIEIHIPAATGTVTNPVSDDELRGKFRELATPPLGADRAERLIELVDGLESLEDVGTLLAATVPSAVRSGR